MKLKKILPILLLLPCMAYGQDEESRFSTKYMDTKAKPGTDFYRYACGKWLDTHPLTAEHSRYGQFNHLSEQNARQVRQLIENLAANPQEPGSLAQKIGTLYQLAMDSTRLNAESYTPIKPLLQQINQISTRRGYMLIASQLMRRGINAVMFSLYFDADLKDATRYIAQVYQPSLTMGDRDYYLSNDEHTLNIRKAYKDYVTQLFLLVGNTPQEAEEKSAAVIQIETQLAQANYSRTKLRDVEANYHKYTFEALQNEYSEIDWSTCLLQLGAPAIPEVSVAQPEPIHQVGKLLTQEPLDNLKAYAEYKVIDNAASSLSDDFRAAQFQFYNKTLSGAQQDRPRWKRAVSLVDDAMGMAVGRMYVEKYFPETSKQRMLQLVENLRAALAQRITSLQWMSEETKKQALQKLSTFYVKIGYPDTWKDYSKLHIDPALSLYENLSRVAQFETADHILRRANQNVDRAEWLMTPQTINAYYNPTTNEICFPAGILQPPFFDPTADDAVNYGAIGVIIGHEMTHGFDDQGAQFDKAGNLSNWWTPADKDKFQQRTQVMEDYFNKIEVLPGMYANGKLTLGENIADNGGLNVAYQAFTEAIKNKPLEQKDGFTPQQRFFLSYGFIWAGNIRDEQLRQYNKLDPHSPGRWRVNGALPHIDAWYKAFNIRKNDKLYVPKNKRVQVW